MELDAEVQAWSYLHVPGLVRRTTAFGERGEVLVLTLLGGAEPPREMPGLPDPLGRSLADAIDETTYRRSRYSDLD